MRLYADEGAPHDLILESVATGYFYGTTLYCDAGLTWIDDDEFTYSTFEVCCRCPCSVKCNLKFPANNRVF